MNRGRTTFSLGLAAVLALPILVTIAKSFILVHKDDFSLVIFLLYAGLPILVVLGIIGTIMYSLYRRRRAAFIILMCIVPFGMADVLTLFSPASGNTDSLGYGATSSLVLTVKIVGFIALLGINEYLIIKDLIVLKRSEIE